MRQRTRIAVAVWLAFLLGFTVGFICAEAKAQVPMPPDLPTPTVHKEPPTTHCGGASYVEVTDSDGARQRTYSFNIWRGCGPETYWHEVFHFIDWQMLGDWHRQRVSQIMGWPDAWEAGKRPPYERAADAFAVCAMHATGRTRFGAADWTRRGLVTRIDAGAFDYRASWTQHRAVCMTLWSAANMEWVVRRPRLARH